VGLITGILGLPLAPLKGTIAIAEQVRQQAEEEFYDPGTIRRQLEAVDRARDEGTLSEDEATRLEDELVDRVLESRDRARSREG
jgi:chorismate mutase